jgi:two-component system sensor histidine kinase HydH
MVMARIRDLWVLNTAKDGAHTRLLVIGLAILCIGLVQYVTPLSMLHWHSIFHHTYYLPIIFAAMSFGWRGGLVAAAIASLSQVPHMVITWGLIPNYSEDLLAEIPVFCAAGVIAGIAAQREQRQRQMLERTTGQLSKVYRELQDNFESMKRTERLYAIGQLSAGLAHEIRNPLASIAGATGILKRNPDASQKRTECLAIIDKECERLNRLLTSFLEFARPRPPRYLAVNPATILDSVIDLAMHALGQKTIVLHKELASDLPPLECDPEQLKQVLLNLVINSIQAMDGSGVIALSAARQKQKVLIQVKDEGCGVHPEHLGKIFDPFFTTKENGTGLGLSVVHQIVEQHGGLLTAQNNPDRGMTVSVLLPVRSEKAL